MPTLLANTVFSFPAILMAGWMGIAAALATELAMLWIYLGKHFRFRWILGTFLVANLLSTLAGLPILVTRYRFPSKPLFDNLASLWIGVTLAFAITVFVEYLYFRRRSRTPDGHKLDRRPLIRAIFMANFAGYAVLLSLHLAMS